MRIFQGVLVTSIALSWTLSGSASASDDAVAAYQPCTACHGDAGQGKTTLGAPALAGQDAAYLARQLSHFRSGTRGSDARDGRGAQMRAMAVPLTDEDIAVLSSYLTALPRPVPAAVEGDLKNGNNVYHGNCGACHGGRAEGNPALNAPGLAWLDAEYLKLQFRNYQQGVRGTHPDDTYGKQMQAMSSSLSSDKDLNDVIAYIYSLATE